MEVKLTAAQKKRIANSKDLYAIMREVLKRENKLAKQQEYFWLVGLNTKNRLLFIELIGLGRSNMVAVNTKRVFKMAIYKDADTIIVVHNHPSGRLEPSESDHNITFLLKAAGNVVGIPLTDHLIISEKGYLSFKDKKLL